MQGWIKLHRELVDKPIWFESTPEQKTILITLLMMASHKENEWEWKGEKFKIQPGQFITSIDSIVRNAGKGISVQNVRTALKRFEKYGFLTNESTNKNRLITIVNWGLYQSDDNETNKQTNKQLTSNQQATNNYQECKNVKNERNIDDVDDNSGQLQTPTVNAYQFYEQNGFGTLNPFVAEKIGMWIDDLNEELVIEALKRAVLNNKRFWNYVESILRGWLNKGLKTLQEVEADDAQYKVQIEGGKKRGNHQQGYRQQRNKYEGLIPKASS